MKTLRILILIIAIPVFVSALVADAIDQDGVAPKPLQISSLTDDLDLLCHKTKPGIAPGSPPSPAEPLPARSCAKVDPGVPNTNARICLPLFLRPPPAA